MVAVKPAEIPGFLSRPPAASVVLVYGPDAGLVAERVNRLVSLAAPDPSDPFAILRLEGDAVAQDPQRLADEAHTVGLFGGKRVIVVRAGAKNLAPIVKPVLDHPSQDAVVVIHGGDLARSSPLRTLCERSGQALAIPCYPDGPRELAALVDEIMGSYGLQLEKDAQTYLLAQLGADRQTTRNEVEKLALYARGKKRVTAEDVAAICGDAAALAYDGLVDAVFLGRLPELDSLTARLIADGADPGVLTGFLLRHGMSILAARQRIETGVPPSNVIDAMRLHFKRKDAVLRQLSIWRAPDLEAMVAELGAGVVRCRRHGQLAASIARVAMWSVAMRAANRARMA